MSSNTEIVSDTTAVLWRRPFSDRDEAARELAARLESLCVVQPLVLGLPRSGMPVAAEVARQLEAPLDLVVVRRLGLHERRRHGLGAVAEGGIRVLSRDVFDASDVSAQTITGIERRERAELVRRAAHYRRAAAALEVRDRLCVVVDDAIVSGGSMRAALRYLRTQGAGRVILAAPVGARQAVADLGREADAVVVVASPDDLRSVGSWYREFPEVCDETVVELLRTARRDRG